MSLLNQLVLLHLLMQCLENCFNLMHHPQNLPFSRFCKLTSGSGMKSHKTCCQVLFLLLRFINKSTLPTYLVLNLFVKLDNEWAPPPVTLHTKSQVIFFLTTYPFAPRQTRRDRPPTVWDIKNR